MKSWIYAVPMLLISTQSVAQPLDGCTIQQISWTATGENYEPAQTQSPGGTPRHVSDDAVRVTWSPATGEATLQWQLQTHYPFPATWTYTETLDGDSGTIEGKDGFRPTSGTTLPPARRMARQVDLWLRVPDLLAERAGPAPKLGFVEWQLRGGETGLESATAEERDPPWARREHRVTWGDWRTVQGLRVPGRVERRMGGQLIRREHLEDWKIRTDSSAGCADPAALTQPDGAEWAAGMTHWLLRRIAMGAQADTDMSRDVELLEVGEGLFQVLGASHHSLVIVEQASLLVVDAPLYPDRTRAVLDHLEQRWPGRPVSHVLVTHHHHDHTGGLAPYVRAGARLVAANGAYYREILSAHGLDPDAVIELDGPRTTVPGSRRGVELVKVVNSHADAMFAVHVPDARHVFVADIYSPGREAQNPLLAEEFHRALKWHGLTNVTLSGGHGRGAESFDNLQDWVESNGASKDLRPPED